MTTIGRVKNAVTKKASKGFNPMSYLKENRTWVIERIQKHHFTKAEVISCMGAVKDFALQCESEVDFEDNMDEVIMLHNYSPADAVEENQRELRRRIKTHLYN